MYLVNSPGAEPQERGAASALLGALARTPGILDRGTSLAGEVAAAVIGRSTIAPHKGDRRFADPAWVSHPFYRRLGQAYLTVERPSTAAATPPASEAPRSTIPGVRASAPKRALAAPRSCGSAAGLLMRYMAVRS